MVHHHARPLYVPHCCTGAQLHTRQTRYMYALKAPTCPHDKTSSTSPFQSCKELSPQFCVVFLMHASSSVLGRSLVDCCDPCAFPLLLLGPVLGPVLAPVLGAVLGPVLGTTIRIERTGAKTEAKTGSQIWTQKWNHFRKIVRAFFRACGESLSAMELPMFCNFRLFLVRAHPCTHSATANSSEARSYWKKNARKREEAQSVPPAIIVAADIQTVHVATNRITCKNLMQRYTLEVVPVVAGHV